MIAPFTPVAQRTLLAFYRGYTSDNCLQIGADDTLVAGIPGLAEFPARKEIDERHAVFQKLLLPEKEWVPPQRLLAARHERQHERVRVGRHPIPDVRHSMIEG